MLQPLGDRILIRPEENPDRTESGLHLVEEAQPETMGVVAAVGFCTHPKRADATRLSDALASAWCGDDDTMMADTSEAAALLIELTASQPSVKVGDTVVFSHKSGQEIQVDGTRYLIMRESDILAVLEGVI